MFQYHSPLEGESQKPSRQAKADAVGGGRRAAADDSRPHRGSAGRRPITPSFCNRSSSAWLNPQSFKAARVCSPGSARDCWIRLGVRRLPPTGSTAGSALSPTPPQGGSDLAACIWCSSITPPLRGSRRSRAARRWLMRWGADAGLQRTTQDLTAAPPAGVRSLLLSATVPARPG